MLPIAFGTNDLHAPAVNVAAVVTYPADGTGRSHVVLGFSWSYDSTPTGGTFKIEDGAGRTVYIHDCPSTGPGFVEFPHPRQGSPNTALICTLAAAGASCTGKLNILGHFTTTNRAIDALAQYGNTGLFDFTNGDNSSLLLLL